jgi:hypothetical protein
MQTADAGKGDDLACARVAGDVEVDDLAPIVAHNDKNEEHPESRRWCGEPCRPPSLSNGGASENLWVSHSFEVRVSSTLPSGRRSV